jgi:hypothetical protein
MSEERFWELMDAIAWEIDGYPESDFRSSVARAKIIIKERDQRAVDNED